MNAFWKVVLRELSCPVLNITIYPTQPRRQIKKPKKKSGALQENNLHCKIIIWVYM